MTRSPAHPLRILALAVAGLLVLAACSGGGDGKGGVTGGDKAPSTKAVLTSVVDGVIIPSYEALTANLTALDQALGTLCSTPSGATLDAAKAAWRDTDLAWQSTRPSDVGPAIERRLMSSVGFRARPLEIEALVAGSTPVDVPTLAAAGSGVRGIFAVEVALFAPGGATLVGADGARRCTYARSATALANTAAQQVLDDWTGPTAYRATFIKGMDGHPQSSVEAVVNELTFRLQEADDQGLRSLVEATTYEDLPDSRTEGPAAYGLASLRSILEGVVAVVHGPDGELGLADLVAGRSKQTAEQLDALATKALRAVHDLPDSIEASLAQPAVVKRADTAVSALRVYVSTTVASQLGVTIGFSDADGDS